LIARLFELAVRTRGSLKMQNVNERPLCHRAEDLVTYLYGEAGGAEAADFADHMRLCDACRAEFNVFRQVHESIFEWRTQALGIGSLTEPAAVFTPSNAETVAALAGNRRTLSAIAAVREFFSVAPVWLRGATALAVLCLCALIALSTWRLWQQPAPNGGSEAEYTKKQLDDAVAQRVKQKVDEIQPVQNPSGPILAGVNDGLPPAPVRKPVLVRRQLAVARVPRLTRQEREQLAADLRLIPSRDEDELPFVLSDEPEE
jgi:hypothetical protein